MSIMRFPLMLLVELFFIELKEVVVDATTIIHTTVSGL